ncbi:MAG: hypothetical protein WBQ73_03945 [Candidatus Babeliales bacterium]
MKKRAMLIIFLPVFSSIQASTVWVNVFIHGVISIKPHMTFGNFFNFLNDHVDGSAYADTVGIIREDDIFFRAQAIQKVGLHPVVFSYALPYHNNGARATAYGFHEIWKSIVHDQDDSTHQRYFTFGWSALLSHKARYKAAIALYRSLDRLIAELKKKYTTVKLRLIGYSHGGNVILNLALVKRGEKERCPFSIDESYMIGMPIQRTTDYLVSDPLFKKVYNIYSGADHIQRMDIFAPGQLLSRKRFIARGNFKLPKKLKQIQIKVTRNIRASREGGVDYDKDKNHGCFIYGKAPFLRDISPGHLELWCFGWHQGCYRERSPLYPFPIVIFVPLISYVLERYDDEQGASPSTYIVDFRPEYELVIVRNKGKREVVVYEQLLQHSMMRELREAIMDQFAVVCTRHERTKSIRKADRQVRIQRKLCREACD